MPRSTPAATADIGADKIRGTARDGVHAPSGLRQLRLVKDSELYSRSVDENRTRFLEDLVEFFRGTFQPNDE